MADKTPFGIIESDLVRLSPVSKAGRAQIEENFKKILSERSKSTKKKKSQKSSQDIMLDALAARTRRRMEKERIRRIKFLKTTFGGSDTDIKGLETLTKKDLDLIREAGL